MKRPILPLLLLPTLLSGCPAPATGSPWFEPAALFVEGVFGYDASTTQAVAYSVSDEIIYPTLIIEVLDARYFDEGDSLWRCEITLTHEAETGLPMASWVDDTADRDDGLEVWFGFDMPSTATVTSDCVSWNPDPWGDDPLEAMTSWTWGLGLSTFDPTLAAALEATVVAQYGEQTWAELWSPEVFGGGVHWSGATEAFPGGYLTNNYGVAAVLDDNLEVVFDNQGTAIRLAADDVMDGTLPTGAYAMLAWYGIDAKLVVEAER